MSVYTGAGLPRNTNIIPSGLTIGGHIIWTRTGFSVALCNRLAEIAGLGGRAA